MALLNALLLVLAAAAPAARAANCYGSGNPGFSVEEFQQTAAQVCNYGPDAQLSFSAGVIQAQYSGTEKLHCWDAFNDIIAQCVQDEGRNGGEWDWNYGDDQETYYIQGVTP